MKKKSLTNLDSQPATENKKVRNAKTYIYNGIKFRSGLEVFCYKVLVENNIDAVYESKHLVILDKFECGYESYEASGNGSGKILSPASKTIRQITYNPDFMSKDGDVIGEEFIIECKGYKNDAFPNKLKLIKKHLTDRKYKGTYYMPRNQKQVRQVVELILQKRQTNGTKTGKTPTVWADNMPSM